MTVRRILGLAAIVVGLLWIFQGLGMIHWPASSFMIGRWPWAVGGALMVLVGAALLRSTRR